MKMTRKLIPALVMLLVSAIMLSTASFAWFASNGEVFANGMSVKVNSNAQFLEISNEDKADWSNSASAKVTTSTTLDLVHATIESDNKTFSWYKAAGATPGSSEAKEGTTEPVTNPSGYARVDKFNLRMSSGSQTALTNVKVSAISVTGKIGVDEKLANALRVLVVGSNGIAEIWTNESGTFKPLSNDGAKVLCETVPYDAAEITVYIYFDGESNYAYTNNASLASIQDAVSVSITFVAN